MNMRRWLIGVTLMMALVFPVTGCSSGGTTGGNEDNANDNAENQDQSDDQTNDDQGDNANPDIDDVFDCGSQTVTNMPGAGYLQLQYDATFEGTPEDSALGKVVSGGLTCTADTQSTPLDYLAAYEIDESGNVINVCNMWETEGQKMYTCTESQGVYFTIEDACLAMTSDAVVVDDDGTDETDDLVDPDEITDNPCEENQVPVGHDGIIWDMQIDDEYICVEVQTDSACLDCYYENGTWYWEIRAEATYVALGSIDNVSVANWAAACQEENTPVSINQGDQYKYVYTIRQEISEIASPEDLGYVNMSTIVP